MNLIVVIAIVFVLPSCLSKAIDQQDGFTEDDTVDYNAEIPEVQEEIRPWLILPIPVHTISKKALTILSRWRPLDSYIEAAASAVAASVSGPTSLDFVSAETRGQGRKMARQRTRVQPLRWGRRKRVIQYN